MKIETTVFKEFIEELGLETRDSKDTISIIGSLGTIGTISKTKSKVMNIEVSNFFKVDDSLKEVLYRNMVTYASIPVEKRDIEIEDKVISVEEDNRDELLFFDDVKKRFNSTEILSNFL